MNECGEKDGGNLALNLSSTKNQNKLKYHHDPTLTGASGIFLVTEHHMDEVVAVNHWINCKLVGFMRMKGKHFVLYCWYVVNIYHTCGLGNQ